MTDGTLLFKAANGYFGGLPYVGGQGVSSYDLSFPELINDYNTRCWSRAFSPSVRGYIDNRRPGGGQGRYAYWHNNAGC